MRYVGFAVLALIAIVVVWALGSVNNIPRYEESANAAWAQVLNQYQRRADLVPNLVQTVKGAANFEQSTLEAVVQARAKVGTVQVDQSVIDDPNKLKQFDDAQKQLTSALSRLLVVSEQYPELRATSAFRDLQ